MRSPSLVPSLLIALWASLAPLSGMEGPQAETLATWDFGGETTPGTMPTAWQPVTIPHIFRQNGLPDHSAGWYRHQLEVTAADLAGRVWLVLDGKATVADVRVNGETVGRHISPYTAAWFDLTPRLHAGSDNLVLIRISNRDDEVRDSLARSTLYSVHGGMFRTVRVVRTGAAHLAHDDGASGLFLTPTEVTPERAVLQVATEVRHHRSTPCPVRVSVSVEAPDQTRLPPVVLDGIVPPDHLGTLTTDIAIPHPQRWELHHGQLYTVTAEVTVDGHVQDRVVERTGLRTFAWKAPQLLLNGAPVLLRGVNQHAQDEHHGNAITREAMLADGQLMAAMGVNFIRLAHYPHDQSEYAAADEAGLGIWAENGFAGQNWAKKAEQFGYGADSRLPSPVGDQITREMVRQLWNHPSILFWSAGNEAVPTTAAHYAEVIRQLDRTRVITYAMPGQGTADGFDVTANNTYAGWYGGTYTDPLDPLISETGAGSWLTHHQPWDRLTWKVDQWESEEYTTLFAAARLERVTRLEAEQHPLFTWWLFREFYDRKFKDNRNTKGLITLAGLPKDLYYLFQAYWRTDAAVVRLAGRHHVLRQAGRQTIVAISNQPQLTLDIDGQQQPAPAHPMPLPGATGTPSTAQHLHAWSVDLAVGTHVLRVQDGHGHDDGYTVVVADQGRCPLPPQGPLASLTTTEENTPAVFVDRPIEAQGPVFTAADASADNTWDALPASLHGARWIGTGRTSLHPVTQHLALRQPAVITVVFSAGTFPTITLRAPDTAVQDQAGKLRTALEHAGFTRSATLVWRGHDLVLTDAEAWSRSCGAGVTLDLPTFAIDAVTLVQPASHTP